MCVFVNVREAIILEYGKVHNVTYHKQQLRQRRDDDSEREKGKEFKGII